MRVGAAREGGGGGLLTPKANFRCTMAVAAEAYFQSTGAFGLRYPHIFDAPMP